MTEKNKHYREIKSYELKNARRLRGEMTKAESVLWGVLRNRQLGGHKFRRQHPLCGYIVDFYCAKAKLVVEIDGDIHALPERELKDKFRSDQVEQAGNRVIRFTNDEVLENLDGLVERLLDILQNINPSKSE